MIRFLEYMQRCGNKNYVQPDFVREVTPSDDITVSELIFRDLTPRK